MNLGPGLIAAWILLSGCAVLHHVQIGEIDNRHKSERFEILLSEFGINLEEAGQVLKALQTSKVARQDTDKVTQSLGMFYMGPQTGNMVFNHKYADVLFEGLKQKCSKGKVTGLTSVRESNKYPVVSGEIIKLTGYCVR